MKVLTEPTNSIPIQRTAIAQNKKQPKKEWTPLQKTVFRIGFIFFALFCIPLDTGFYKMIWFIDYAHLNYRHLTEVFVFYNPQFINHFSEGGFFGWQSYVNLVLILVIAVAGGIIWGLADRKSKECWQDTGWHMQELHGDTRNYSSCRCPNNMRGYGTHR